MAEATDNDMLQIIFLWLRFFNFYILTKATLSPCTVSVSDGGGAASAWMQCKGDVVSPHEKLVTSYMVLPSETAAGL